MNEKTYVVLEEIHGISKKGNPYHMVKFADAATFANHVLSVDANFIAGPVGLKQGQKIKLTTDFVTDFRGTNTVIQAVKVV